MYLPRFSRAGVLRYPHLGGALTGIGRVHAVHNQLRQLSLAIKPRLSILPTHAASSATSQQVRFATNAASGEKGRKAQERAEERERAKLAREKEKQRKEELREQRKVLRQEKQEQREQKQKQKEEKQEAKKERQKQQKIRDRVKELKEAALQPPKKLPSSWYSAALVVKGHEIANTGVLGRDVMPTVHASLKSLTPDEIEQFKKQAEENVVNNHANFKTWIQSHSALEIRKANEARLSLRKQFGPRSFLKLQDERQVRKARPNYTFYYRDRVESGDLKHMAVVDMAKQVSSEWNNLNETEREPYNKMAAEDKQRHLQEYREVYGMEKPPSRQTRARKKSDTSEAAEESD